MYKSWKRITAALLSVLMCMNGIISPVYAEGEELPEETVMPEETPAAEEPAEAAEEAEPEAEETEPEETEEAPGEAAEETAPQEDAEEASVPMASEEDPVYYELNVKFLADGLDPEDEFTGFMMKIYDRTGEYDECEGTISEDGDSVFEPEIVLTANGEYDFYFAVEPAPGYEFCNTVYRIHLNVTDEGITEQVIYRGTAETEEQILDDSIYTEPVSSQNEMTFEFQKMDLPEFMPKAAVLLDNEDPAEDGIFTFTISDETGEELMRASNTGRNVIFDEPLTAEPDEPALYTISQVDDGDGSITLDNSEYTFEITVEWNEEDRIYEQTVRLLDEAEQEVPVEEENVPCFYNYSEETVSLDTPLTVRVESDDASLLKQEYEIEFKGIETERTVTEKTVNRETEYKFDAFITPDTYRYEIRLKAEDGILVEEQMYEYWITVILDEETDELLIESAELTYNDEPADAAVFHVSKDGSDTPDPDDELLKEIEQKKKEYDDAFAALEAAQAELAEAKSALSAAEGDLNDAKEDAAAKASAVTAAEEKIAAIDAKKDAYEKAEKDKLAAEAALKEAQDALDGFKPEYTQEDLDAAEAELEDAKAAESKGSVGFFESRGSTDAIDIINEGISLAEAGSNGADPKGVTKVGEKDDATTLDNMRKAIEFIKEGNELRAADPNRHNADGTTIDGVPDVLVVSDRLMAIAQVRINMSQITGNHWKTFYGREVGENISFGYPDPFDGWHDEEGFCYDYIREHPNESEDAVLKALILHYNPNATDEQVERLKKSGRYFVQTGHYTNLINPDNEVNLRYLATGFGVNTEAYDVGYFALNGGQVFSRSLPADAQTVEDYSEAFEAYVESIQTRIDAAQAEVDKIRDWMNHPMTDDELQQKVNECKADVAAKTAAYNTAKAEWEEAESGRAAANTELENARAAKTEADQTVTEKQAAYNAAKQVRDAAQEKVNAAQALVNEKLATYEEAAAKLIKVTDIQIATSSITMHYNETGTLTATVIPEDAYVKSVSWESSNPSVVTITESGSYHAVGEGDAELTVRSNEPGSDISKTVSVHVNAPEISGFEEISHQYVESGNEPEYPETVTALYEDGTEKEVSVIWEKLNKDQYGIREGGEFTVTGTVEGTDMKPEFKVTVNPATVVSTYLGVEKVPTKKGVYPKLPATAEITWSNGDHSAADVEWEEIFEDDYAEAGEFTAHGLAKVSETASVPVEIEVEVYEVTITSIDDPEMITVPSGTEPAYPAKVHVYYNDNSEGDVPVTWKKLSKEEYSIREGKTYTVNGAVEGFHGEAELKIVVNPAEIESIKELEPVRTKINVAPELPAKAEVKWTNGEVSEEDIHWNEIPEKLYAKEGTFKAEGYVENAKYEEVPVSVQVTVFVPKIVSFEELSAITVPSGTEPQYPENVTAKYDDETSAEVPVEWEKLTKAQYGLRKGGEFIIKGTVKGTEEKPELTIIVEPAEPKGYETDKYFVDTALVITTGMKPSEVLPAEVRVEWTNGDVTKERVTWDKEADDVKTQPGPVYMYGTITVSDGRVFNVYTNVYVNKAGNWNVDPGDVTKEDAAQVNFNIPEGLWAARDQETLVYNGAKQTFDFRVYNGNRLLVNKKDYTFKYSNNKNAGIHDLEAGAELNWKPAKKEKKPYITITGKGNYSGKIYVPFDILPVTEELTTVPSITVKYNKKVQKPSPAVMYERTTLKKGTDYTLTYLQGGAECPAKEPGSYTIHVQGKGNYEGSYADVLMTIEETPNLASGFNVKVPNVKYESIQDKEKGLTVEELKDLITVTYGKDKETVTYGTDYELEVVNAKSVGKATLYVKGVNGYTGTKTITFNITGVPIKQVAELAVVNPDYTGDPLEPAAVNAKSGFTLEKGTDYELIYTNNTNAGKATVTLKGIGNYTGSIKKTFKILPKELDNTFTVSVKDAVYVKGDAKPAVTVTHDGKALKAGTDYTVKYSGNKKLGKGTATITGKGNYKGTIKEDFAIDYADLSKVTVTVADKVSAAKMYSAVTLTDSDGKKLKAGTDYIKPSNSSYTYVSDTLLTDGITHRFAGDAVQPKDIAPAGTLIQVTVISNGNYTGTAVAEYRILEKGHDLSKAKVQFVKDGKIVKSLSKEYTGSPVKLEKSDLVVKVGGVVLNENDYDILDDYANNVNKGTATVTIAGKGGYGGTKEVKFKIGAEKMTVWETLAGLFGN